jgi:carbamoyltransferase
MPRVLGISAYYHDSAAALVIDGRIAAAAQEERFSRLRHDHRFPAQAIAQCLQLGGLRADELDLVAFYEKPLLKFERILETAFSVIPSGLGVFWEALPAWLHEKLHLPREMRRALQGGYSRRFVFVQHHEAHGASAFYPSPFEEAAVLTVDGVGEWATTAIMQGQGTKLTPLRQIRFPHSLGLLYSAFTHYCGFRINSGEYKLMGLAPYGEPRFAATIEKELLDLRPDGSFRLNMAYLEYCHSLRTVGPRFESLFGAPSRRPDEPPTQHTMDVAASIQRVTEKAMVALAREARRQTGSRNLCLAGGVALNCVANGRILEEAGFDQIWIQPAAGDAGGALGAALFVEHGLSGVPRHNSGQLHDDHTRDAMQGALLGPEWTQQSIHAALQESGIDSGIDYPDMEALCGESARLLADGQILGWFQGRMEFGPRALGSRSILADARNPEMQVRLNLKTKFRESFRPFAPVVLEDMAHEWFSVPLGFSSPYMLMTVPVSPERRLPHEALSADAPTLARLAQVRSTIPAVTHVDHSARVQTVAAHRHPHLHSLLRAFHGLTTCPILVNTSFNVRGEPIVCSPADAIRCFLATGIDALALGRTLLRKSDIPPHLQSDPQNHLSRFGAD